MNNVRNLWCQETAAEERRIAHLTRFAARKQAERVAAAIAAETEPPLTVWDKVAWAVLAILVAVGLGSAMALAAEVAAHGMQSVLSGL